MLCKICGIREEAYRGECKVCSYKKRHKAAVANVIENGKWDDEELDTVIYHMLCEQHEVINEILPYLPGKTLGDLAILLECDMPIKGTAKNRVSLNCASCGDVLVRPLKHYFNERVYCNFTCRDKYKTAYLSGENSPFYKRVKTICANCGTDIFVIPFDYDIVNSEGDRHNFCSQGCYYQYRSRYYFGERHPMYNYSYSDEQKETSRQRMLGMIASGAIPHVMTKPHTCISELLCCHDVAHQNEWPCAYYSIDIYLERHGLMIEVMGDYWHASPLKYSFNELSDVQKQDVKRDKSKHTYVQKYCGCEILYLWESDIKTNIDLCWQLIDLYISRCGILENYHSFNYHLQDGKIALNDTIINPFFYNTKSLSTAGLYW